MKRYVREKEKTVKITRARFKTDKRPKTGRL